MGAIGYPWAARVDPDARDTSSDVMQTWVIELRQRRDDSRHEFQVTAPNSQAARALAEAEIRKAKDDAIRRGQLFEWQLFDVRPLAPPDKNGNPVHRRGSLVPLPDLSADELMPARPSNKTAFLDVILVSINCNLDAAKLSDFTRLTVRASSAAEATSDPQIVELANSGHRPIAVVGVGAMSPYETAAIERQRQEGLPPPARGDCVPHLNARIGRYGTQ